MDEQTYEPPVDQLLTLGGDVEAMSQPWPDYPARFGLTADHVPDLLRILADPVLLDLNYELDEDDPRLWAVIHAWRALGQLRAEAAIEPMLALMITLEDVDWLTEEGPEVLGLIGPAAIAPTTAALARTAATAFPAVSYSHALQAIAEHYPETRDIVVAALIAQLELYRHNDPGLNAFLVMHLAKMKVLAAASLIEEAFAARRVDDMVMGDWEDVQIELGLLAERLTPFEPSWSLTGEPLFTPGSTTPPAHRTSDRRRKAKRKQARASRKQNRRRKKR